MSKFFLKHLFRTTIPILMATSIASCDNKQQSPHNELGQGVVGIGIPATSEGAAFYAWNARKKAPSIQFSCQKRTLRGVNASVFDDSGNEIAVAYGTPKQANGTSEKIEGIDIYKVTGTEKSFRTLWLTTPILKDKTKSSGIEAEPLRTKVRFVFRHCYAPTVTN